MYRQLILFCIASLWFLPLSAQQTALNQAEINNYRQEAERMVSYFEGTVNFLGSSGEVAAEKDIIINDSYLKIFPDQETQIEDDLDERRQTPLNKDVQAYLKDIMFFYKSVSFSFDIVKVDQQINQNNQVYFKVTTNRSLQGINVNGDTISNSQVRYFEINLDQQNKDLKIASIYTTKLNEKEELRNWWNNMSNTWKQVFGRSVLVYDTLPFMHILSFTDSSLVTFKYARKLVPDSLFAPVDSLDYSADSDTSDSTVTAEQMYVQTPDTIAVDAATLYKLLKVFRSQSSLSIAHNHMIRNLEPLAEMSELTDLDISYTLIDDLTPIRNLNKLRTLSLEACPVTCIDPLRYLTELNELNAAHSQIARLDVLSNLKGLAELNLDGVPFSELSPLAGLSNLRYLSLKYVQPASFSGLTNLPALTDLNLSSSSVSDLQFAAQLTSLQSLNIDSTKVRDLTPLSALSALSVLQANATGITNLTPLLDLPVLRTIYCDRSGVTREEAARFMEKKPGCLVVYNSAHLVSWWNDLDAAWKQIFLKSYQMSEPVSKEQLHQLINQQSLSLAYHTDINNIEPLSMLHRLEDLDLQHTDITDLSPVEGLNNLKNLRINNTQINSLIPLSALRNLKTLQADHTLIADLMPLSNNSNLTVVLCDASEVGQEAAMNLKSALPECVVVYQTEKLRMWWNYLSPTWRKAFREQLDVPESPSDVELQQLADLTRFEISNYPEIKDLAPLNVLLRLEKLVLNNTGVQSLTPVTELPRLTEISLTQSPIADIGSLIKMKQLKKLNLENTPVENVEPLKELTQLIGLNLSGTKVQTLKYLSNLTQLEELSISNTRIKNLKPISGLKGIKLLQCYNTPLKQKKVDEFISEHPQAEVIFY